MSRRSLLVPIDAATPPASLAGGECALVIGNFDGVHRGHQAVLRQVVAEARARGLAASVLTFDPHPAVVVGTGAPPLLATMDRRVELMGALGVERAYVRRFDAPFATWTAERFVRDLVADALRARVVVVGHNFRFGAKRAGDLSLLRELGAELGFEARVHPVARDGRGPFSSTRAREAIAAGELDEACRVLGRPHELSGPVVHGDERGRMLGFPTANLDPVPEMLPPHGVYAVTVDDLDEQGEARQLAKGVTNVGLRPTVAAAGGAKRTIETFLLDFAGDLYGRRLRLHLVARLRDEQKFGSLDELKAQIARDVVAARSVLLGG
ncbi:MAG TPA: bifunctional riboflavin kinase/FAD synthetase [Polyangiaceae bacterium]|nr:bifunctional riboflavin kinase/FAD synthetase [Polyangiaceae bacterium]